MSIVNDFIQDEPCRFFEEPPVKRCLIRFIRKYGGGGGISQVFAQSSTSVVFSGTGTESDPLEATTIDTSPITHVSTDTAITDSMGTVIVDVATLPITITLPSAVGRTGRRFTVKKNGSANGITVDSAGGNIDGSPSEIMGCSGGMRTFQSDGTDWWVVNLYDEGC